MASLQKRSRSWRQAVFRHNVCTTKQSEETAMDPNSDDIVQQIKGKYEALLAYVTKTDEQPPSIYQVERHLLTHLLSLGRLLLLALITTQQAQIKHIASVCVNG